MKIQLPLPCLQRWLLVLYQQAPSLKFDLRGVPGKMRIPRQWQVRLGPQREHLLYYVVEGGFEAEIGDKFLTIRSGDLLWMAPGTPFYFRLPPGQGLVINRFRLMASGLEHPKGSSHFLYPGAWSAQVWMEQIIQELGEKDPYQRERLKSLLICLIIELARLSGGPPRAGSGFTRQQRQQILQFSTQHVKTRLEPGQLASHLGLSHDYFTRLFRRSFQMPPRRWLMEQRIRQAALRLLESTLNVSQVAEEFGYQDVFLFSRQFKAVLGVSPLGYRRRGQGG